MPAAEITVPKLAPKAIEKVAKPDLKKLAKASQQQIVVGKPQKVARQAASSPISTTETSTITINRKAKRMPSTPKELAQKPIDQQIKPSLASLIDQEVPMLGSKTRRVKPCSAIRLFQADYQRLSGNTLKYNQLLQHSDREFNSSANATVRNKYHALANEVNRLGIDTTGEQSERAKVENLKSKIGLPEVYIDTKLLLHYETTVPKIRIALAKDKRSAQKQDLTAADVIKVVDFPDCPPQMMTPSDKCFSQQI